jgi:hypothetical protein
MEVSFIAIGMCFHVGAADKVYSASWLIMSSPFLLLRTRSIVLWSGMVSSQATGLLLP